MEMLKRFTGTQLIFLIIVKIKHLMFAANKKSEITLEHQEIVKVPLSTRRVQILRQEDLEPRHDFLKSLEFETDKGFHTMRRSDTYRQSLDSLSKSNLYIKLIKNVY